MSVKKILGAILNTPEHQAEIRNRDDLRRREREEKERMAMLDELEEIGQKSNENISILTKSLNTLEDGLENSQCERTRLLKEAMDGPSGRTNLAKATFISHCDAIRHYEIAIQRTLNQMTAFVQQKIRAEYCYNLLKCNYTSVAEAKAIMQKLDKFEMNIDKNQIIQGASLSVSNSQDLKIWEANCKAAAEREADNFTNTHSAEKYPEV